MRKQTIFLLVLLVVVMFAASVKAQQDYSFPTTPTTPFYVAYARVDNSLWNQSPIISTTVARTLQASESGSTVITTTGSGITITLPLATPGLAFDVVVGTTQTAGNFKVITGEAADFLAGVTSITQVNSTGAFSCNGTTHISILQNGTTTGGIIGSKLTFRAISTSVWQVIGDLVGSGAFATPCSTT